MKKINNIWSRKFATAKELGHKFHLSYQIINHYTDLGLLSVALKNGNVRFYDARLAQRRLRAINKLMKEGYSLRLIRKKLIGI